MSTLSTLKDLGDAELETALKVLLERSARTEAHVVMHLAEVDRRRLHSRTGFPSLFRYCLGVLGFSEFEAVFRIAAARLGRRFPLIFELLERRQIHLSALHLLRHHLTDQNHRELLAAACHKSKRQVELLLAYRFPRPDVPTSLRELQRLDPLSPGRYHLELTIDEQTKHDLDRACELLSHVSAKPDFALVVKRSVRLLVEQLEKQRFGQRSAPAEERPASHREQSPTAQAQAQPSHERTRANESASSNQPGLASEAESSLNKAGSEPSSNEHAGHSARSHIPNHVRKAVAERDERCCTFVSPDGRRCRSRRLLQIHHDKPWARGGTDTIDNLRLLCAEHNQLLAEHDFGAEHIEQARERRVAATRSKMPPLEPPAPAEISGAVAKQPERGDPRTPAPPLPDKVA